MKSDWTHTQTGPKMNALIQKYLYNVLRLVPAQTYSENLPPAHLWLACLYKCTWFNPASRYWFIGLIPCDIFEIFLCTSRFKDRIDILHVYVYIYIILIGSPVSRMLRIHLEAEQMRLSRLPNVTWLAYGYHNLSDPQHVEFSNSKTRTFDFSSTDLTKAES